MKQKQSGSGLIFAVILMFVILAMVVTLSSITVLETKMNQKSKSSVGAFYNADSGVEWALNKIASGSGAINTVFSGIDATTGKKSCPDFGSGSPCDIYFLDSAGKVINSSNANSVFTTSDISLVKAVRSVGTQSTGEVTQRAIEAAVAANTAFGSWSTKSANTIYQAATDGFIVAFAGGTSYFQVKTDSNSTPTAVVMQSEGQLAGAGRPVATVPVRKSDYWKVETLNGTNPTVSWLPLGN